MVGLSRNAQDGLILFGLGITTFAVVGAMRTLLITFRNAAVIPPSPNISKQIDQEVEDALKPSTLEKLLSSNNYSIQSIAAVIVCERAINEIHTIDTLLWQLTRPRYESREQAIRALTMVTNSSTIDLINKPRAYAALIRSLEYSVDDYEHNQYDPHWDNYHLRDTVEQGCLLILSQLVDNYGVKGIVRSGFIPRWLAKEPWGPDPISGFLQSLASNDRLSPITRRLFREPAAREQLKKAKLLPPHFSTCGHSAIDLRRVSGESTAGDDVDVSFVEPRRPRHRDQSIEEEHLRRRHREAMVFNDGTRPVERGDIIERER